MSEKRELTGKPLRFKGGWSWEMDEAGWHRIVSPALVGGEWAPYGGIAVSPEGNHICVTQYYGEPKPEIIHKIIPLEIEE